MIDPGEGGLRIRPVRSEDGPDLVHFLEEIFGHWGTLDDWLWKYQAPPAPFRFHSILAECRGQIVGHYGLLPLEATCGGRAVPAAQAVDAGVLPEYRRQGLFTSMARAALGQALEAGAALIYAFPGLLSLDVNLHLGYRSVAFVPEMVRALDLRRAVALAGTFLPGDLAAGWAMRRGGDWMPEMVHRVARLRRSLLLLAGYATAPHLACRKRPPASHIALCAVERFDSRLDALWARLRGSDGVGLCKDARYLNWRYGCHPSRSYLIIAAGEGEQWAGCLVLRHDGLRSQIAELLVLPERGDVVGGLLAAATAQARSAGSVVLSAWAPAGHPARASLRRAGFVSPTCLYRMAGHWPALARWLYQVVVYMQHLSPERQRRLAAQATSWPLSMGDSDLV